MTFSDSSPFYEKKRISAINISIGKVFQGICPTGRIKQRGEYYKFEEYFQQIRHYYQKLRQPCIIKDCSFWNKKEVLILQRRNGF